MARYIYVIKNGKAFTVVQLKNTRTDVIAKVKYHSPDMESIVHMINPGFTFTDNIKTTEFLVEVSFIPYKPGDNSPNVIEWEKKKVSDIITVKNGEIQTASIAAGVR